jgi:hypothetical protein
MNLRLPALVAALTLAAAGPALAQMAMPMGTPAPAGAMGSMTPTGPALTIKLNTQNNSGEYGTATLTPVEGGTMVSLKMIGSGDVIQPAHIHHGPCATLDPKPTYSLPTVQGGVSMTVVKGVTLSDLLAAPWAINVHKSTTEVGIYVACGDIVKPK